MGHSYNISLMDSFIYVALNERFGFVKSDFKIQDGINSHKKNG